MSMLSPSLTGAGKIGDVPGRQESRGPRWRWQKQQGQGGLRVGSTPPPLWAVSTGPHPHPASPPAWQCPD